MKKRRAKRKSKRKSIMEKPLKCTESKTLTIICQELFQISKGRINGETKTRGQLYNELKEIFNTNNIFVPFQVGIILNIKNKIVYCVITKTAWGYDYYIPQTRKDEERLKKETGYYDT